MEALSEALYHEVSDFGIRVVVIEPGYYETQTILRLETNLYDVESGELVWSGQSETFDPNSVEDVIDSVTQAVARRLRDEGLIP